MEAFNTSYGARDPLDRLKNVVEGVTCGDLTVSMWKPDEKVSITY
jgi:hypothetical protein